MSQVVYSERFFDLHAPTTDHTYTVPDGFRAVFVTVILFITTDYVGNVQLLTPAGGVFAHWGTAESAAQNSSTFYSYFRAVFYEGETITAQSHSTGPGTCDISASGYLLSLP